MGTRWAGFIEAVVSRASWQGYPKPVDTVLGLLGLALFIVFVVSLAASVTWLVVRFSPSPSSKPKPSPETGADG